MMAKRSKRQDWQRRDLESPPSQDRQTAQKKLWDFLLPKAQPKLPDLVHRLGTREMPLASASLTTAAKPRLPKKLIKALRRLAEGGLLFFRGRHFFAGLRRKLFKVKLGIANRLIKDGLVKAFSKTSGYVISDSGRALVAR